MCASAVCCFIRIDVQFFPFHAWSLFVLLFLVLLLSLLDRCFAVFLSVFQGDSSRVRRVSRAERPRAPGGKTPPERAQQASPVPAPQEGDSQDFGG